MTTTYDPKHPLYFDEADVREELTRVYDLCHGCRLCFKFCTSFPTLFEMVDKHDDQDAGRLTPAEQDQVVDECFQCKLCYINCPYIPELHEWNLDFPRLMLRADAMQHANGIKSVRDKTTTQVMGRTDLLGTLATSTGPIANKIVNAEPGSGIRKVVAKATGVSPTRLLPPYAKQRFSTWFKKRPKINLTKRQGKVTVFPTCLVEYQETRDRQGPRQGVRTQRHRVQQHRRGLLRRSLVALRQRQGVHQGRREEHQDPRRRGARRAPTSWCRSRRAATSSRRTTSTTWAVLTPNSSPNTPTTPPST